MEKTSEGRRVGNLGSLEHIYFARLHGAKFQKRLPLIAKYHFAIYFL
jgi:hypothetical protein